MTGNSSTDFFCPRLLLETVSKSLKLISKCLEM